MQMSSAANNLVSARTRRHFLALAGTTAGVALAGCTADDEENLEGESHIGIQFENRDDVAYEYRIVVERGDPDQGDGSRHTSSGTISAETTIEVGSTLPLTRDEHRYSIDAGEGQVSRTWNPVECSDYFVAAAVERGSPSADGECRAE